MPAGSELTLLEAHGRIAYCVSCHRCGHKARLNLRELTAKLGEDYPVTGIRTRLRCSRCGAGEQIVMTLWLGASTTTSMLTSRGYPIWPGD